MLVYKVLDENNVPVYADSNLENAILKFIGLCELDEEVPKYIKEIKEKFKDKYEESYFYIKDDKIMSIRMVRA